MAPLSSIWAKPEVNPINNKARAVPFLNPFCLHGRVFFFSWLGFMVSFLSWYAFPPLTPITLKNDLGLTNNEIANANIVALLATFLVRVLIGPLCDRFGPRKCMVGCMLAGAIPTALAGTAHNAGGLIAIRFFVGILGGTFVPCQVWCTGFFDKNCVGRANAIAAGWGNAGGGITYFVMPAVFDSLVRRGLTAHVAWRVSFATVPFIIVVFVALMILFFTPDTPTGPWKDRHLNQATLVAVGLSGDTTPSSEPTGQVVDVNKYGMEDASQPKLAGHGSKDSDLEKHEFKTDRRSSAIYDQADVKFAEATLVKKPTIADVLKVAFTLPVLTQCACYFCTFGAELAINSNLSSFYIQASGTPAWSQTLAANWAAMYGLLNVITRPMGGFIADKLYVRVGVEGKKFWMIFCVASQGLIMICIGAIPGIKVEALIGALAVVAIFTEAGNGANFAVVPHVLPANNGIVSGLTGASGNFGGIIFNLVFRFNGTNYHKGYWIIGTISLILPILVCWIRVPKLPGEMGWLGKPRPQHV